jgi:hypothetical protein
MLFSLLENNAFLFDPWAVFFGLQTGIIFALLIVSSSDRDPFYSSPFQARTVTLRGALNRTQAGTNRIRII